MLTRPQGTEAGDQLLAIDACASRSTEPKSQANPSLGKPQQLTPDADTQHVPSRAVPDETASKEALQTPPSGKDGLGHAAPAGSDELNEGKRKSALAGWPARWLCIGSRARRDTAIANPAPSLTDATAAHEAPGNGEAMEGPHHQRCDREVTVKMLTGERLLVWVGEGATTRQLKRAINAKMGISMEPDEHYLRLIHDGKQLWLDESVDWPLSGAVVHAVFRLRGC